MGDDGSVFKFRGSQAIFLGKIERLVLTFIIKKNCNNIANRPFVANHCIPEITSVFHPWEGGEGVGDGGNIPVLEVRLNNVIFPSYFVPNP